MSNAASEDDVKKALGIESWRNLSKDGVMQLVTMMPELSKDVALKIAEQFPDFKLLVTQTLDAVGDQLKAAFTSNDKSQKRAQKAFQRAQEAYIRELDKDLTVEERRELYDRILDVAREVSAKDDQNKQFGLKVLTVAGSTIVAVLLAAVAFVGGRGKLSA
jgi:hypothetical protein